MTTNMEKQTIIMGIDPGTIITGYGIIQVQSNSYLPIDFGCIKPPNKLALEKRYLIIFNALEELIRKFSPTAFVIETQFVKNNPAVAIKLGMARGVAVLAATKNNIPVFEYAPKKAKLAVVGHGQASKHQVKKMIQAILKIPNNLPQDAADALSLAICHTHIMNNKRS
jgi:crossover junction endodeoxyribonuclease RuvC